MQTSSINPPAKLQRRHTGTKPGEEIKVRVEGHARVTKGDRPGVPSGPARQASKGHATNHISSHSAFSLPGPGYAHLPKPCRSRTSGTYCSVRVYARSLAGDILGIRPTKKNGAWGGERPARNRSGHCHLWIELYHCDRSWERFEVMADPFDIAGYRDGLPADQRPPHLAFYMGSHVRYSRVEALPDLGSVPVDNVISWARRSANWPKDEVPNPGPGLSNSKLVSYSWVVDEWSAECSAGKEPEVCSCINRSLVGRYRHLDKYTSYPVQIITAGKNSNSFVRALLSKCNMRHSVIDNLVGDCYTGYTAGSHRDFY
jgi:hypothetical protein